MYFKTLRTTGKTNVISGFSVELARFQRKCFNMDLETGTLDSLKTVVMKNCPEGIQNEGLTFKGFVTLNKLFIQRGRHETTWTILRKFGYTDELSLSSAALVAPVLPPTGSTAELTHAGIDFLLQVNAVIPHLATLVLRYGFKVLQFFQLFRTWYLTLNNVLISVEKVEIFLFKIRFDLCFKGHIP